MSCVALIDSNTSPARERKGYRWVPKRRGNGWSHRWSWNVMCSIPAGGARVPNLGGCSDHDVGLWLSCTFVGPTLAGAGCSVYNKNELGLCKSSREVIAIAMSTRRTCDRSSLYLFDPCMIEALLRSCRKYMPLQWNRMLLWRAQRPDMEFEVVVGTEGRLFSYRLLGSSCTPSGSSCTLSGTSYKVLGGSSKWVGAVV